jgi:hypothetical protein
VIVVFNFPWIALNFLQNYGIFIIIVTLIPME